MKKLKAYLRKLFPSGSFIKNIAILMTGTVFSQVLIIIVAPILTRLYTPDEMGVFTLFTSVLGVVGVAGCWRYNLAIPLPEEDSDAANLLVICIVIAIFMGMLSLALVALFRTNLAEWLQSPELGSWLWFLPFSLIITGIFSALNYWSARRGQFKRMAVRQITQNSVTAVSQSAIKLLYPAINSGGLIGGYVLGQFIATSGMAAKVISDEGRIIKQSFNLSIAKKMLIRYKEFPLYNIAGAFLNIGAGMIPVLLLGSFFGNAVVGFFGLGNRVLGMPASVIGVAVGQAYLPKAAQALRNGDLPALTLELFKSLVRIAFVPMLLLMIVAPDIFAFIFGVQWYEAGVYVRWTGLWVFINFVYGPLSLLYGVLERQKDFLVINTIQFVLFLTVLIYGGMNLSALETVALTGIAGFFFYFANSAYILYRTGISVVSSCKVFLAEFLYALPYVVVAILTGILTNNEVIFVGVAIITGIVFLLIEGRKFRGLLS